MPVSTNRDEFDNTNDFTARTNLSVGPDEFTTVEELDVEEGEAVTPGVGSSLNPLQAEGSISGNIEDGGASPITGKFRLVVLNSQNNVVGKVAQGSISTLEQTRTNSVDGYILPFSGQEVAEPYKLGFQLRTNSGTATYSASNSSFTLDGYRAESMG